MAELNITLTAAPILGTDKRMGGNQIRERNDLSLVSIAIPKGGDTALETGLQSAFGVSMPSPVVSSSSGDMRVIKTAPDQLMLLFTSDAADAEKEIHRKISGSGYVTNQTDGWIIFEITGPDTLAALERLCPLNLHHDRFAVGAFARTVMEHMGAMIIRTGEAEFLLLSASSSAKSFYEAIVQSYDNVMM